MLKAIKPSKEPEKTLLKKTSLPQPTKTMVLAIDKAHSTFRKTESLLQKKIELPKPRVTARTLVSLKEKRGSSVSAVRPSTLIAKTSPNLEEIKQPKDDVNPEPKEKIEKTILPIYKNITDLTEWKKKHNLDPKTKVYITTKGYGDIKRALDKRGWVQNPDFLSPCFDLRWTIKSKEIEIKDLHEFQIVNHFEKNSTITTKVGLCKSLKNLIHFCNVDIDSFFPKCFNLNDEKDYEDFIEEFKYNKAESILKVYARLCKENEFGLAKDIEEVVKTAIQVCEKKLIDLDQVLEDCGEIQAVKITDEEWKIISVSEISVESLARKKYEARLAKYEKQGKGTKRNGKRCLIDVKALQKEKENIRKVDLSGVVDEKEIEKEPEIPKNEELLAKVENILEKFKVKNPQDALIGDKNIWMLKPAGLSRGRGITALKNLIEILDVSRTTANQWVVQKYIENPLIIHKRKFDIRQWVLVTDWNPLTIWFYDECYVRFSGAEYNTEDLENRFVHLTNNSVVKHMKKEGGENEGDDQFEGNMWRMDTFQEHLQERFGKDVFEEIIKPKMKKAVTWSLESVQDMIGNRKNSFELYGYDFMVDEDLNVWLIEINLSPALDYSTPVTKRLVKMMCEDLVKVVVDYGMAKKSKKKDVDTGLFKRTHKSKRVLEKPINNCGFDLVCEGIAITK